MQHISFLSEAEIGRSAYDGLSENNGIIVSLCILKSRSPSNKKYPCLAPLEQQAARPVARKTCILLVEADRGDNLVAAMRMKMTSSKCGAAR